MVLMALSGLFYMTGITFYLRALQGHEASMVAPFFQSSPLFGYVLAYLVLGETLSPAPASRRRADHRRRPVRVDRPGAKRGRFRWQLAALMLCAGFVLSLSTLIFKAFAIKDEFWATTFWMFAGEALFGVGLPLHRPLSPAVRRPLQVERGALLAINASNELINLGGGLANRYALIFAPLAIVQAIGSTTTLFVFVIGVLLTLLFPEDQPRKPLGARVRPEGHRRGSGRDRRRAGQPLAAPAGRARLCDLLPDRPAAHRFAVAPASERRLPDCVRARCAQAIS